MNITVENKDILQWADEYTGPPFHAIICDPPYELGFMGRNWDSSGIAFDYQTWAAIAKHLHPGGFGMAFAASRGWHRMAVAIEDAGLTFHPSVFMMGYCFGSGFPKATRINGSSAWEGHRYGLQALKPALEPVIVFQKPYNGKPVDSIVRTGAGALNIDDGRIGMMTQDEVNRSGMSVRAEGRGLQPQSWQGKDPSGRWPANLILTYPEDRKDEVREVFPQSNGGAFPKTHGASGFASPEERERRIQMADSGSAARFFYNAVHEQIDEADPLYYTAKPSRRERDAGLDDLPLKSRVFNGKSDHSAGMANGSVEDKFTTQPSRNIHPTVKPINLIKYLTTLLLPPSEYAPRRIMVPFAGSGSEMIGAMLAGWEDVVGIERESEYVEIARKRIEHWKSKDESRLF